MARFASGSMISRYEVLSPLGEGGMGEVYLCNDPMLERKVAIKVLATDPDHDEHARTRFLREARAAAQLSHPNVCAVYEVGESGDHAYIAMQYVEGQTLAQRMQVRPLSVDETLRVARDSADALEEAHRAGIIHRDVKPQNMIITSRGRVIVLDFGLAKMMVSDDGADLDLTRTNTVAGTVPYMSPEQLRGELLDGRTDIFSLGVVLYELVTGGRPFTGGSMAEVIASIMTADAMPLDEASCGPIAQIIHRCLHRDRNLRYAGAKDLLVDLEACLSGEHREAAVEPILPKLVVAVPAPAEHIPTRKLKAAGGEIESLAVLPFGTGTATPEADLLGEGITESLIVGLSAVPKLRVMARGTVFRFRDSDLDPCDAGRQLGVDAVLSGRIHSYGDRFVIRAELVNVDDGAIVWSDQYSRSGADVFLLQEEIAARISEKLRPKLTRSQKQQIVKRRTSDPAAYELYIRGLHLLNRRDVVSLKGATDSFHRAIDIDSSYAAPYCGLAEAFIYFGFLDLRLPREVYPSARAAAQKALELDPSFAEAHAAIGWMKVTHEWDWEGAEQELREAVRLNPNCAVAHHWHGLLLSYTRRFDEAAEKLLHARSLDPLAPIMNTVIGSTAHHAGRFEEAIRIFDDVAELAPRFVPLTLYRGIALEAAGRLDDAIESFQEGLSMSADEQLLVAALGHCLGLSGRRVEAGEIMERLIARRSERYTSAYGLAIVAAGLGDESTAFGWLEIACEERAAWLCTSLVDSRWNQWRDRPRFRNVMKEIGFPQH